MLGNLRIYLGPDAMNAYAAGLRDLGALLWIARAGLLAALLIHIFGILALTRGSRAARPQPYALKRPIPSTYASRHMLLIGAVLLAFVAYHLLHFTMGVTHPEHFQLYDGDGRHDVYSMVILGFREPLVAISYIFAMGLLGLHLSHGVGSAFRSAGLGGRRPRSSIEGAGRLLAIAVVAGNVSIPLACLLGAMQPFSEVL